jgi:pyoverdine/dityrosine biosynthesis protein Dit1
MKSHLKDIIYISVVASAVSFATLAIEPGADRLSKPSLQQGLSKKSLQQAAELFNVLKPYQLLCDIDKAGIDPGYDSTSQYLTNDANIIQELAKRFQEKAPLHIVLIGFPPKSTNDQKKVLSKLPDMAERYGLLYLHGLLKKIKQIYPFGTALTIISDGVVFNDVIGISDTDLKAYEGALKLLSADLEGIRMITSDDLQQQRFKSLEHVRDAINQCEPTEETFHKLLKTDTKMRDSYALMQQRIALELDHPKGQKLLQNEALQDVSRRMLVRSKRFGSFLKRNSIIPSNALHFCVHYQSHTSQKFGVKLSPTSVITPWHGVLVLEGNGTWRIVHRQDIDHKLYHEARAIINGVSCSYFKTIK